MNNCKDSFPIQRPFGTYHDPSPLWQHKLSRTNRDKLQQFVSITGASEKSALQALKASDWQIEAAFDVFYSQPQPKSNGDMRRLEELFSRYKGNMLFLMCFTVSHSPRYCHVGQELGLYKAQVMLPFNAFGTMAMAREEFENDSGSSQVFWLLKESELTPSNSNILDGRYAVFGYVTQNEDFLADLKVGDVIESIQVVSGLDNLVNPSYKIAG